MCVAWAVVFGGGLVGHNGNPFQVVRLMWWSTRALFLRRSTLVITIDLKSISVRSAGSNPVISVYIYIFFACFAVPRHACARAAALAGQDQKALALFDAAVETGSPSADRLIKRARAAHQFEQLGLSIPHRLGVSD